LSSLGFISVAFKDCRVFSPALFFETELEIARTLIENGLFLNIGFRPLVIISWIFLVALINVSVFFQTVRVDTRR